MWSSEFYWAGPNDGGIKRGDSAETGDDEARPTDDVEVNRPDNPGSGRTTGDQSSLGGGADETGSDVG